MTRQSQESFTEYIQRYLADRECNELVGVKGKQPIKFGPLGPPQRLIEKLNALVRGDK